MKRRSFLLGAASVSIALALLASVDAYARPGGGSSFKGSSSGGSRSSGSSGSSGFRSSSGSSGSRSSGSSWSSSPSHGSSIFDDDDKPSRTTSPITTPSRPRDPEWGYRQTRGEKLATVPASPGASIYPAAPAHGPIPIAPDTMSTGAKVLGFVFGGGIFVFVATVLSAPAWIFGLIVSRMRKKNGLEQAWATQTATTVPAMNLPPIEMSPTQVRREMRKAIGAMDPDFSIPIFEDFLAALYTEAHVARGTQALEKYSPYLRPVARAALAGLPRTQVNPVIVGAIRLCDFRQDNMTRQHRVTVEIEANYTENPGGAYYALERWTLVRAFGARSRPPNKARALVCPNCGAPLEKSIHGRCTHCGQAVDSGQFDWVVERIEVLSREARGPMLTGTTEEQGTTSPTIVDPDVQGRLGELRKADATLSEESVQARVGTIFQTMQKAWSSLEWKLARPCLTDRLWNAQTYWIEAHRQQGLRNITENARILKVEVVRASWDKWYHSVTVRIHATGLDYTIRHDGDVVGGSRSKERPYTEYWTLLRSAAKRGASEKPACPNCGAPLPAEMVDKCGYCGALVEASSFDWVLSRIEQDEVYAG